jgi:hypothetical protein
LNILRATIIILIIVPWLIIFLITPCQAPLKDALATDLTKSNNYPFMRPLGFAENKTIIQNESGTSYPAFNYGFAEINQTHSKGSDIVNPFLPMPDLKPEVGTSPEATKAEEASQDTQMEIERMVNPSTLLSSAINDIRESGGNSTEHDSKVNGTSNQTKTMVNAEFSTIHLYGKNIPPKDYLIIETSEATDYIQIYATARIPCNDAHKTPLKIILLENWSKIIYPLPEMHLVKEIPNGELCMFRIEYPKSSTEASQLPPKSWGSTTNVIDTSNMGMVATVLYNSGVSDINFPKGSSVTLSHIDHEYF